MNLLHSLLSLKWYQKFFLAAIDFLVLILIQLRNWLFFKYQNFMDILRFCFKCCFQIHIWTPRNKVYLEITLLKKINWVISYSY